MNYRAHYDKLVARGQRTLIHGYREQHHIIPKCMGGTDDEENLVYLTAEEHYVAHQLLVKMYPDNRKLIHAANMMCVKDGKQKRNNKEYSWLKQRRSDAMKNRVITDEARKNMSNSAKGHVKSDEHRKNLSIANLGKSQKPCSEERKAKLSKTLTGRKKPPRTQEHTDNWRAAMQRRKELK
jgi:hypothetical protein